MPEIERAALGTPTTGPQAGFGAPGAAAPQRAGLASASRPPAADSSTVDTFAMVAVPGRDLLARVDRAIERVGAPPAHPVYALLSRLGIQPCEALDLFAGVQPQSLATLAAHLRATAAAYRDDLASPLDSASKRLSWGGAGHDAFTRHWQDLINHLAGQLPEGQSMTYRLDITASYTDALADWYDSGRRALVRALVDVLPTREAVTLRACPALAGDATAPDSGVPGNSAAVSVAAAEIAHHVLTAIAEVYDAGVDTFLPGPNSSPQAAHWQEYLPALPFRPTTATPATNQTSSELWIRL